MMKETVSLSPGVIATPMGHAELAGPFGDVMRMMVEQSGTGRIGTPDEIAAAVEFLVSPGASFISGTDLLVDGGVVAAMPYARSSNHSGTCGGVQQALTPYRGVAAIRKKGGESSAIRQRPPANPS